MTLPLSPRLSCCCTFVRPGDRVADIGCDHGYLGIHLLLSGIASSVIAADINAQPLESAKRNAEKYGVLDKMAFFLTDGLSGLPQDFDALVLAGMGADTMIAILQGAPWLCSNRYRLILQCQSKTPTLRRYLSDSGWAISNETVVRDGRFLYTVIEACFQPNAAALTAGQCFLSPALLQCDAPEKNEYINRVLFSLYRAVNARKEGADPVMTAALSELLYLKEEPQ